MNQPWRILLVLLTLVGLFAGEVHCAFEADDHHAAGTDRTAAHCELHCCSQALSETAVAVQIASPLQPETTQVIPAVGLVSTLVVMPFFQPPRA